MSSTVPPRRVDDVDSRDLGRALDLVAWLRHPVFVGTVFAGLLAGAGLVVMLVSGLGMRDEVYVSLQLPYVVSGAFAALGLVAVGALVASVLGDRRDSAEHDRELADVVAQIAVVGRLLDGSTRGRR